MTDLSQSAQAVLNTAARRYAIDGGLQESIASALRAAVDQVEPDDGVPAEVRQVLNRLLAIAAELRMEVE